MNPLDILIIIILSYCLLTGIFRGLIREIASIVGVFGGFYCGYTYYKDAAKFLSQWFSDPAYLKIMGFLAVFGSVFIIVGLLGILVKRFVKAAFGEWFDRATGAGFGVIKGILISSVLLVVLVSFLPKNAPVIKNSVLAPQITKISMQMANMIPKDMKRDFFDKLKQFRDSWKKKYDPQTKTNKMS